MQRYHAASCSSAVNNNSTLSGSVRDSRVESSSIAPNYSLNSSRRPLPLTPYKLKCDRDSLNTRLGPPDYHPQTPHCAEETLPKEYVLSGYKEAVEGLEESREISLSQIQNLTKPVIARCREALRKYHRAINESRAQKRKAGQVYGVQLSGNLLTKPCSFPELRPCGEEFRKKWIEGLSQRHKRLCTLADHVPHGYRRKSLFEILIRNNVPLLRATWFIKITYLNQVRPGSSSFSTGLPDRTPISRSEQWTKDIIDYLQGLLDEFLVRNDSLSAVNFRDRSPQVVGVGSSMQHRVDPASDGEEPSLHFKWWYVVRILQCHHAEGLILPSLIIDWVFNQLQEKPLLGVLQLLLPVIYGVINAVVLCQTYVRTLVGIAIRYIQEPSPGGSDLVDNSRRAYTISALVEMLRYLIFAVPDNFVALDCFPLPSCVVNQLGNDGNFLLKAGEKTSKRRAELQSDSVNSLHRVVSSVQKCTETLARAARPGHPGQNFAKALQALDKSLVHGDMSSVYRLVFENLCDGAIGECWISEVSSCLRSTLTYIGGVPLPLICSVFLICEWATCDFRDFRAVPPSGLKFSGRKDISQIYIAMRLLKVKNRELQSMFRGKNESLLAVDGNYDLMNISKHEARNDRSNIFGSSSPLHDIIVCWIDQHQVQSEGGVKHLQLFITELIRAKIFYPQAYVRQLLVSGIMDSHGVLEYERRKRHHRILKQLPSPYVQDVLEEAGTAEESVLSEVMTVYSNERRLVLHGLLDHPSNSGVPSFPDQKPRFNHSLGNGGASPSSFDQSRSLQLLGFTKKKADRVAELEYLKASISALLQLPGSSDKLLEDSVGSNKRSFALLSNKVDVGEGTPGCEECRKVKRQKLIDDKNSYLHRHSPNNSFDDEEFWWVKKGQKPMESYKADPPKPAKQAGRGRQKVVRKTQSLAQLAASRIEGSQGASTSHVCDNKVICPHHRSGAEVDAPKSSDGIKTPSGDVVSIGKALKKMRFTEKRAVISWMVAGVKQQLEEAGKTTAKVGQYGRPPSTGGDRNAPVRWKLGEDELSYILYLMDISSEIVSAVRFLLWLLPKTLSSATSINGVRNILMLPRNSDNLICEVGEAFLISSIRRFENVIAAADLVPETLSAAMHRVTTTMASTGRISGSAALAYARHLWKKYSNVASVVEWEKTAKSTYDKRLMSELESGRLSDFPLGVPAGVEDLDDFFRQKISGVRVSRVGLTMQRQLDEVFRKIYGPGMLKNPAGMEKSDDGYQTAQQVVMGLMDCMRQTGGAAQEGDPSLVSSAISAILSSVGQVIARIPDLTVSSNHLNSSITSNPLTFARRVLRVHVLCLCLLKDALGERQSRVFEVALAAEACNVLVQVFVPPGKGPRSQYQMSPDPHDSIPNSSDILNSMTKVALGRTAKITGAISALVIGTILQGITNLERMVCLLRLREGLDPIQFLRSIKSNSNGNTRSIGVLKQDSLVEVSVHWFRVLVGNCRTVSDGFIVDLLGEASVISLSRMQRALPINLVFPPAYTMFAFVKWKGFMLNSSIGSRDDFPQMYQSLVSALGDAIKHLPFREVCLRDTHGLYDLIAADSLDSEFAVLLDSSNSDLLPKAAALVPLRARLFLNALVDCKLPQSTLKHDDGNRMYGQGESRADEVKDKLVHVLDTLQPAKFHWQWVELRLLLNEQAVIEKLEAHDMSLVEAVRSVSPNPEKVAASENENNFVEIILTRLLVRPDAAPLFSEVVHLLGRSLEDSMLLQTKWFLGGNDVLYGRKSIRQRLINIAESKNLSTRLLYWKPWGWCPANPQPSKTKGNKRKLEPNPIEEGDIDDGVFESRLPGRGGSGDPETLVFSREHVTERAFIELILPCVDQGSEDSRTTFASDMIKQMSNIEQLISTVTRGATKSSGSLTPGIESTGGKSSGRKGMRGGSPGLVRRSVGATESVPPSPAALRASLSLRLQFLLRLLPIICSDRESSVRNMRHTLAAVILRLIGSRVVHEDASNNFSSFTSTSKRDADSLMESFATASVVSCGESLFDRLLLVLHGLLSSSPPSWLKSKPGLRSTTTSESFKDFGTFDREMVENLQNELDRMQLPDSIRWRVQTAMPVLLPSVRCSISCQPPSVTSSSLGILQSSNPISVVQACNSVLPPKNPGSLIRTVTKAKAVQQEGIDLEVDPWSLLEDGAGAQSSSSVAVSGGSDPANLRALNWLKGTVRVRRSEMTYIGAVDEDS